MTVRVEEGLQVLRLLTQILHTLSKASEHICLNMIRRVSHLMLEEDDHVESGEDDEEQECIGSK